MNKMEAIIKLIDFALGEVGTKETPKNITKYSAYFNGTDFYNGSKGDGKTWGAEWCDIFVDYCFCNVFGMETGRNMLCQPKKSAGAGCKFSANYYKNAKRFYSEPEVGDQIFFIVGNDINHTGIVTKIAGGKIHTVEGNAGDMVSTHSYSPNNKKIAGYGRPNWELVVGDSIADSAPIAPTPVPSPKIETKKSNEEIAREVINGKWGNGNDRKNRLTKAGYDYAAIQSIVNQLVAKKPVSSSDPVVPKTFIGIVNTVQYPLNVRAGAGTQYRVVKTLPKGSKVKLYEGKVNGWYKLADNSGYVAGNLIKK